MKKPIAVLITDTHITDHNIDLVKSSFKQLVDTCKKIDCSTVFHLGDWFTTRTGQSQNVLLASKEILDFLVHKKIELTIIPGNHDKLNYVSELSYLHLFHFVDKIGNYLHKEQENKKIVFHFIPFFSDSEYKKRLLEAYQTIKTVYNLTNKKHVLFTHIGIEGMLNNDKIKIESELKKDLFSVFDAVFVGHYHDFQAKGNITYIGSDKASNFGENNDKGCAIVYDDLSFECITFDFPHYDTYYIDIEELTQNKINALKKEKESNNSNIRVIITGNETKIQNFNKNILLDLGINCVKQLNNEKIDILDKTDNFQIFDKSVIISEFNEFCKKNKLNYDFGKKYLDKVL